MKFHFGRKHRRGNKPAEDRAGAPVKQALGTGMQGATEKRNAAATLQNRPGLGSAAHHVGNGKWTSPFTTSEHYGRKNS